MRFVLDTNVVEIERGVTKMERQDAAQGAILRRWFDERVLPAFADRVLPFDLSSARVLASFRVPERAPRTTRSSLRPRTPEAWSS